MGPLSRATPPGTGNAFVADPVASLGSAPGRRNARKGVGWLASRLKVRANPTGNRARQQRPDRPKLPGARAVMLGAGLCVTEDAFLAFCAEHLCCDALRCSGPHARYTDGASEYSLVRKVWVILLNSVVLGIEHCNYCSSTRNP